MMTTLQGMVNRGTETRLWLRLAPCDEFWLAELIRKQYVEKAVPLSAAEALEKYAESFRSAVVYDPAIPASINVATMIASLENGIVIAPDRVDDIQKLGKEIEDLRGRWKSNVKAYRWAFETLWPRMNHRVLACYHPSATAHHLRDYLVRNRVFHFWVTSREKADGVVADHAAEAAFLKELLSKTPVGIPVIGFWFSGMDSGVDEYPGVGLAGEYGKITVVCDWATNLSLLSGVRVDLGEVVRQYRERLEKKAQAMVQDRVYIAYDIVESGDSPSYLETRQQEVWKDPKRGTLPINWSMGPAIFDLAPPIAAYYYEQATPKDYLYPAISGAGYCHPYRSLMKRCPEPEMAWREYLTRTAYDLHRMGGNELGLYTDAWTKFDRAKKDPVTLRFIRGILGVKMLVLGMGRDEGMTAENGNYMLGAPPALVSHILTRWPIDYAKKTREENIQWLVEDIRAHTPATRPAFVQVMALSWVYGPSEIAEVQQRLGEDYVPVTLPEYAEIFGNYLEKSDSFQARKM